MFSKTSQGWVGPSSAIAEDDGNLSNVWFWDEWLEAGSVPKKVNNLTWLENQIEKLKNWAICLCTKENHRILFESS